MANLDSAIVLLNCFVVCLAVTSSNSTTDHDALLAIKSRISSDPLGILATNWSSNRLSPTVFNISSLRTIDFTNNDLSGSLPDHMVDYKHSNLKEIYLKSNHLNGRIPSSLWEVRSLEILSLSYNEWTGSLPKEIGNLTMLKYLYLGATNLTGVIPNEIGRLINLKELNCHEGRFSGPLPYNLFNTSAIEIIDLYRNEFSGHLPPSMGRWHNFSGKIPESTKNASKLVIINLSSNSFSGSIPNNLGDLEFLERLLLGENNLTRDYFTPELKFLSSLTNCRNLKLMVFALNPLGGFLPASLGNFSSSLYLIQAFGSKIRGSIPIGVGNLSGLTYLGLDQNELTGPIPSTIGRLHNLEVLYLEQNKLKGHIPDDLCALKNLGDLYVSQNGLNGSIPACLGGLKSLQRLFLDSNRLTSMIPSMLWSLKDLVLLNLSSNSLSGDLPSTIGTFKVLTLLDLSYNQLSGYIPRSIGGAQQLSSLRLSHNKFGGNIPESVGALIGLEILDLSDNNLLGNIPQSLQKLRYLQYLNVSWNRLQGEIPDEGSFVNFTALSFVGNVALCGTPRLEVPQCGSKTTNKYQSKFVSSLKYILPFTVLALLIAVVIIILLRSPMRNIRPLTTGDSILLEWTRVSYIELLRATESFNESNILGTGGFGSVFKGILSDDMVAHVGDFGLAKILGEEEFMERTMTLATVGYMAPEYGQEGLISTRGDVYNYGIILMETFTRKKPTDEMFSEEMSLRNWVNVALHDSIYDVVDKNLVANDSEHLPAKEQCVSSILSLALDCTTIYAAERPTIEDVVVRLQKIRAIFQESLSG
ncbi:receptor kinase-like protein Xa21 [Heracleum sosnowskyi]|uniref:non-specific serine/threonine protein kinase n=1 Tax=Heracleum sosnowskyi TaxID=360622 RepID=A0AAD8HSW9_9APIA|nr:receptor kinase-like protein Xa21 [Heracleum sosnowskyi]